MSALAALGRPQSHRLLLRQQPMSHRLWLRSSQLSSGSASSSVGYSGVRSLPPPVASVSSSTSPATAARSPAPAVPSFFAWSSSHRPALRLQQQPRFRQQPQLWSGRRSFSSRPISTGPGGPAGSSSYWDYETPAEQRLRDPSSSPSSASSNPTVSAAEDPRQSAVQSELRLLTGSNFVLPGTLDTPIDLGWTGGSTPTQDAQRLQEMIQSHRDRTYKHLMQMLQPQVYVFVVRNILQHGRAVAISEEQVTEAFNRVFATMDEQGRNPFQHTEAVVRGVILEIEDRMLFVNAANAQEHAAQAQAAEAKKDRGDGMHFRRGRWMTTEELRGARVGGGGGFGSEHHPGRAPRVAAADSGARILDPNVPPRSLRSSLLPPSTSSGDPESLFTVPAAAAAPRDQHQQQHDTQLGGLEDLEVQDGQVADVLADPWLRMASRLSSQAQATAEADAAFPAVPMSEFQRTLAQSSRIPPGQYPLGPSAQERLARVSQPPSVMSTAEVQAFLGTAPGEAGGTTADAEHLWEDAEFAQAAASATSSATAAAEPEVAAAAEQAQATPKVRMLDHLVARNLLPEHLRGNKLALFEQQIESEQYAIDQAVQRYQELSKRVEEMGRGADMSPSHRLLLSWLQPLEQEVTRFQDQVRGRLESGKKFHKRNHEPYLLELKATNIACIVIHEVLNTFLARKHDVNDATERSVRFAQLSLTVGQAINAEVTLSQIRSDRSYWRQIQTRHGHSLTTSQVDAISRRDLEVEPWEPTLQAKVGSALIEMLVRRATIDSISAGPTNSRKARAAAARAMEHRSSSITVPVAARDGPDENHVDEERILDALQAELTAHEDSRQLFPENTAFRHKYTLERSRTVAHPRKIGYIEINPLVMQMLDENQDAIAYMHPRMLPMVVPPRSWTSPDRGGYLVSRSSIMRFKGSALQRKVLRDADLRVVYEALDYLGQQPWVINHGVHNVVERLVARGSTLGDIPDARVEPMPERPSEEEMNRLDNVVPGEANMPEPPTPEELALWSQGMVAEDPMDRYRRQVSWRRLIDWKKARNRVKRLNANRHSQRCDLMLKLGVARSYRDKEFYFPYSVDFRGRAYPIPPHLNHIGSDICRGLLSFAVAKPLGARGLRWLKIHLASLYGHDKLSFDDRERWTEDHLAEIRDSAEDPSGERLPEARGLWWSLGENPWQVLAAVLELDAALRLPDPTQYMSNLPIHQDGSCNGLQHYAALGRDADGGASVNLTPQSKPADVYSSVLQGVQEIVHRHATQDDHPLAKLVDGKLVRKTIKQTVMTSVYGVTMIGAKQQIQNRLEEMPEVDWGEDPDKAQSDAALYLAKVTMQSLANLFTSAREIMAWLATCATLIAKHEQPVSWMSPVGLPVVQPYRTESRHVVRTLMQSILIVGENDQLPVSVSRQRSAFPPNFVHALDASHMIFTTLQMKRLGITFCSVHDSYWTHASTMDQMNESLRTVFVAMYSQPILEDLAQSFAVRFPNIEFPAVPKRGSLDLQKVLESPYFFN